MKKQLIALAASAAVMAPAMAVAQEDETLEACYIYVGPVGDYGWSYQHDQSRQELEAHFDGAVTTRFLESVSEGADAERAIERFARQGCDIVFTTSFGFMDATNTVAERFPDIKFEHATGYRRDHPNVATYDARFYEGRYILGQIAASMSEEGTAGYIVSFPIPEVIQGINSFMLGAQSVDPDFSLRIVWVNTWFDPGRESDAARALIDQGVDVISQHTDSTAAMQVAQERGVYAFGQASDMIEFGPDAQLTAIVDDWAPYYIERVQSIMDGTWEQSAVWDGIGEGLVVMADYTNMPDDVAELARETEERIASGELHPFTGPISRQDGSEWLAEGEVASDEELASMNFYVEGIDDQLSE